MTILTLNIATWLERRLDLSLGFDIPAARLYGIVVNDPLGLLDDLGQVARTSFIDESSDIYELLAGSAGVLARSFDAAAVVSTGWAAPLDGLEVSPSSHPGRRRVRIVTVVDDEGCAGVLRFEDAADCAIAEGGIRDGDLVEALQAMWFGDAHLTDTHQLVNSRTTVRSCRHHS
jgi:hypothetical protein